MADGRRRRFRPAGGAEPVPTWEDIATDHGRFLYTVAYRLTGDHDDAQDLVQEVLVRVQRGLATYQPGALHAWLARITTNVFLDDIRRKARRPTSTLPDEPDLVLPPSPGADEVLSTERLSGDVQQALDTLSEDFRTAIVLCDVVGLSYDEIAEVLGVPVGTVRSRIHRARRAMRDGLTDDE